MDVRLRSASLGLSRPLSPLGILVAQHRVQYAERVAESVMSDVGQVVDATGHAWVVAKVAIAETKTVHGAVENQIALISALANESATRVV